MTSFEQLLDRSQFASWKDYAQYLEKALVVQRERRARYKARLAQGPIVCPACLGKRADDGFPCRRCSGHGKI